MTSFLYARSRRRTRHAPGASIALHAGWNFAQLGLLGVQRPGHATRGAWSSHFTGPPLLSGGDWGPEISIVALVTCLVASMLLLAIAQWRGRTIALFWARESWQADET